MEKHKLPYYCLLGGLRRGSDNFVQLRLSTCYWIYFISLNPGSKYRGKEGAGKSAFQYFYAAGQRLYYQGFYESLYKQTISKVTKNLNTLN